jgi:hypothetical protein
MIKKRHIGWFLIAYFILSLVVMFSLGATGVAKSGVVIRALLTTGVFCVGALWIWMITDFISRKDIKHRLVWGLSLIIFFTWGAAIFYYILIYLPRERREGT